MQWKPGVFVPIYQERIGTINEREDVYLWTCYNEGGKKKTRLLRSLFTPNIQMGPFAWKVLLWLSGFASPVSSMPLSRYMRTGTPTWLPSRALLSTGDFLPPKERGTLEDRVPRWQDGGRKPCQIPCFGLAGFSYQDWLSLTCLLKSLRLPDLTGEKTRWLPGEHLPCGGPAGDSPRGPRQWLPWVMQGRLKGRVAFSSLICSQNIMIMFLSWI